MSAVISKCKKLVQGWDCSYIERNVTQKIGKIFGLSDTKNKIPFISKFINEDRLDDFIAIYPFVENIEGVSLDNKEVSFCTGTSPNNLPHMGFALHLKVLKWISPAIEIKDYEKVLSTNLYEPIYVRGADRDIVMTNFEKFPALAEMLEIEKLRVEDRTEKEIKRLTEVLRKKSHEFSEIYYFGEILTNEKRESLLRSAAAVLWRQFLEPSRVIIKFWGIEELSRALFINHIAKTIGIQGVINFYSYQVPGVSSSTKMSKSISESGLYYKEDGYSAVKKMLNIPKLPYEQQSEIIRFLKGVIFNDGQWESYSKLNVTSQNVQIHLNDLIKYCVGNKKWFDWSQNMKSDYVINVKKDLSSISYSDCRGNSFTKDDILLLRDDDFLSDRLPELTKEWRNKTITVEFDDISIDWNRKNYPGTTAPSIDTFILLNYIDNKGNKTNIKKAKVIVDIGAGSGTIGIYILKHFTNIRKLIFCDNNFVAISLTKRNLKKNFNSIKELTGEKWMVEGCEVLFVDNCIPVETFCKEYNVDLIVANPPYLPLPYISEHKDTVSIGGLILVENY